MRHIDKKSLIEIHNALDDLTLGNYQLAHKQLNELLSKLYKTTKTMKKNTN
jgi:hypothetical protein